METMCFYIMLIAFIILVITQTVVKYEEYKYKNKIHKKVFKLNNGYKIIFKYRQFLYENSLEYNEYNKTRRELSSLILLLESNKNNIINDNSIQERIIKVMYDSKTILDIYKNQIDNLTENI